MCDTWEAGDDYAEGYAVGAADSGIFEGIGFMVLGCVFVDILLGGAGLDDGVLVRSRGLYIIWKGFARQEYSWMYILEPCALFWWCGGMHNSRMKLLVFH